MTDRREPHEDTGPVVEGEIEDPAEPDATEPEPGPDGGFTAAGVPTFDRVRETIEGRVATASGAEELDAAMPEVRSLEQQETDRATAGRDKLEEIRRSMRGGA